MFLKRPKELLVKHRDEHDSTPINYFLANLVQPYKTALLEATIHFCRYLNGRFFLKTSDTNPGLRVMNSQIIILQKFHHNISPVTSEIFHLHIYQLDQNHTLQL